MTACIWKQAASLAVRWAVHATNVPLIHILLAVVQRAALEPTAAVAYQQEAAALVLPALQLLAAFGEAHPHALAKEAAPDGGRLLVSLLSEQQILRVRV